MKNDRECTENRKSEEISYLEEMASEEDENILESHQSRIEQLREEIKRLIMTAKCWRINKTVR